ncbi:hypothetical protein VIGAN_06208400, partial [Vigna angularis var. angularis]
MSMSLVCRFVCMRIASLSLSVMVTQPWLKDTSDMNSASLAGNKRGSCKERNQTECGPLCSVYKMTTPPQLTFLYVSSLSFFFLFLSFIS